MLRTGPQQMSMNEYVARLCEVFGREAGLYYPDTAWVDVSPRISPHWEAIRRPNEPSWPDVQPLVRSAFENTVARKRRRSGS